MQNTSKNSYQRSYFVRNTNTLKRNAFFLSSSGVNLLKNSQKNILPFSYILMAVNLNEKNRQ